MFTNVSIYALLEVRTVPVNLRLGRLSENSSIYGTSEVNKYWRKHLVTLEILYHRILLHQLTNDLINIIEWIFFIKNYLNCSCIRFNVCGKWKRIIWIFGVFFSKPCWSVLKILTYIFLNHFLLNRYVNKENCRYAAQENPKTTHVKFIFYKRYTTGSHFSSEHYLKAKRAGIL